MVLCPELELFRAYANIHKSHLVSHICSFCATFIFQTSPRNELKRGTPPRKIGKGRAPGYSEKRGEAVYKANREACRRHRKVQRCARFISWVIRQVREHKWSLDACCGSAKLRRLFEPSEMVCSRTLYNWVWANLLPLKVMDLPDALRRKVSKSKPHAHKKKYGRSISDRPSVAGLRIEEGHWEGDTVVGKRSGKEAVILTLLEKKTENYLPLRICNRTSQAVMEAMRALRAEFGDNFSRVFQTITVDNGGEFADSAKVEEWSTQVFFAHPCTSWESAQNERHNGLFRAFFPKACLLRSTVRKMSAPPLMNSEAVFISVSRVYEYERF